MVNFVEYLKRGWNRVGNVGHRGHRRHRGHRGHRGQRRQLGHRGQLRERWQIGHLKRTQRLKLWNQALQLECEVEIVVRARALPRNRRARRLLRGRRRRRRRRTRRVRLLASKYLVFYLWRSEESLSCDGDRNSPIGCRCRRDLIVQRPLLWLAALSLYLLFLVLVLLLRLAEAKHTGETRERLSGARLPSSQVLTGARRARRSQWRSARVRSASHIQHVVAQTSFRTRKWLEESVNNVETTRRPIPLRRHSKWTVRVWLSGRRRRGGGWCGRGCRWEERRRINGGHRLVTRHFVRVRERQRQLVSRKLSGFRGCSG